MLVVRYIVVLGAGELRGRKDQCALGGPHTQYVPRRFDETLMMMMIDGYIKLLGLVKSIASRP